MKMRIDDIIKKLRQGAELCEFSASKFELTDPYESSMASKDLEYAQEQRQIAQWLVELKKLRAEKSYGEWETKTITNKRTGEKETYAFCPCCGESYQEPQTEPTDLKDVYDQGYLDGWEERYGEPRLQGEWIWEEDWLSSTPDNPAECQYAGWVCSQCHEFPTEDDKWSCEDSKPQLDFCPNCGTRMGGVQK